MMRKVKISEICPDWNIARGQMWFHFLTQKYRSDIQNQRIRPYFLGQKYRYRYSASIGPVHVPKLGLRPPTNPEKAVERGIMNDFILFFLCFLTKPIIWRDVFLEIQCFMMRKVKISEICPDWYIARG